MDDPRDEHKDWRGNWGALIDALAEEVWEIYPGYQLLYQARALAYASVAELHRQGLIEGPVPEADDD